MAKNKAFLKLDETPFIELAIDAFKNFEEIIIISNNKKPYLKYNLEVYNDIIRDLGPIGGIYTAITYAKYDIVVIPCDMPYINNHIVDKIANKMNAKSIISTLNGQIEPLCSGYKKNILEKIKYCINTKNLKVLNLINVIDKDFISFDGYDKVFLNINTEDQYSQLEK